MWCALEKAAGLATRVHDGLRSPALLAALDGVGCGDEGGNSTAPLEQSPCFSE